MIVQTLKMCTGDAGPEQCLVSLISKFKFVFKHTGYSTRDFSSYYTFKSIPTEYAIEKLGNKKSVNTPVWVE